MAALLLTPRRLAFLFGLFGVLAVLLFASVMPPYMNPDELAHYLRADQVSNGGWLATRGASTPARIDTGILAGMSPFWSVGGDPEAHAIRSMYAPVPWGIRQIEGAPNTAVYPPVLYLPAAAAIQAGKWLGLTVLPTLKLCRVSQGLVSVVVGVGAIALSGPAAIWLFAVLALPMSLAQMAALGQDGLLFSCTALAVSLALRLQDPGCRHAALRFAMLCICLVLAGTARPPYAAFAVLPLVAVPIARWVRAAGAVIVVASVVAWSWLSVSASGLDPGHFNGSDARAQSVRLLWAPWRIVGLIVQTYRLRAHDYAEQFLGRLGWMDMALPHGLLVCSAALLCLAGLLAWRAGQGARPRNAMWLALLAVSGAVSAVFAIQFLTWTPVGAGSIDGVQGRYFLPPALVFGLVLTRPQMSGSRLAGLGAWPVALFPVVTIVACLQRMLLRYYL